MRMNHSSTPQLGARCWLCEAGTNNGPCIEDVRATSAAWTKTCGLANPLPCAETEPGPLLKRLPANELDLAAFSRTDLFHVFHAGIGLPPASSTSLSTKEGSRSYIVERLCFQLVRNFPDDRLLSLTYEGCGAAHHFFHVGHAFLL